MRRTSGANSVIRAEVSSVPVAVYIRAIRVSD
jgi:hypothetical protein